MPSGKKNVLFIVVDDLRTQLGCYGVDWIKSPHIDALAAEGLVFERAYCQQAVCGPSRASVLSGCRPDTTGIYDLKTPLRTAMPDVLSLPEHFKNNGYITRSIGKIYHHQKDDLQAWTSEPVINKGDWQGRGYLTDEALEAIAACNKDLEARGDGRAGTGIGPAFEAADVADEDYHDGKDARSAIAALQEYGDAEAPFFLALGFHKPHLPFNAPKRYWDMYDADVLPLAANPFAPSGSNEFTLTDFGELRGYFGIPKSGDIPDDLARNLIHGYSACVTYMDAQLGLVIDELKRLGLYEHTTIMLWGDHGWKLGEHNSWCKHTNMEIDCQAPLILNDPAYRDAGRRSASLVEFIDMYPTLCELCDLPIPDHCEGSSLVPLCAQPNQQFKAQAFSQFPRPGNVMGYAMRTDRYRYVEWRQGNDHRLLAREVYDHETDARENASITNEMDADVLQHLADQLAAAWPLPAYT